MTAATAAAAGLICPFSSSPIKKKMFNSFRSDFGFDT